MALTADLMVKRASLTVSKAWKAMKTTTIETTMKTKKMTATAKTALMVSMAMKMTTAVTKKALMAAKTDFDHYSCSRK